MKQEEWHLTEMMARKNIRFATELRRRLKAVGFETSHSTLIRMVANPPTKLDLELLRGLCVVLDCTPDDLITFTPWRALGN